MATVPPRAAGGRPRVLVVDDAPDMRRSIARVIRSRMDVVEACDGFEAVETTRKLLASGDAIHAILIDVEMPRLNGKEALEAIAEFAPELACRAIVMSGGTWESTLGVWMASLPPHRVLSKPMDNGALLDALQRALV